MNDRIAEQYQRLSYEDDFERLTRELLAKATELHGLRYGKGVLPKAYQIARLGNVKSYIDGAMFGQPKCSFPMPEAAE